MLRTQLAPSADRPWVGDFWGLFQAGHQVEMRNLKTILEYRHGNDELLDPQFHPLDPPLRNLARCRDLSLTGTDASRFPSYTVGQH